MNSLGYYALYKDTEGGETWAEKVASFCAINDGTFCTFLQVTQSTNFEPRSLKEFEHFFQNSYKHAFNQFSDSFFMDGWQEDAVLSPIDLTTILSSFSNAFA